MDFNFIYSTVRLDGSEFKRPFIQIRCILAKAYELANMPLFGQEENRIFESLSDTPFAIDRTTVERMLLELDSLPQLDRGVLTIASQSTEIAIEYLHILDTILDKLPGTEHEMLGKLLFGGWLQAIIRTLVGMARNGIISTNQSAILQRLGKIPNNAKKVVHLKQEMLTYQQRKDYYDPQHYQAMYDFLKLEKKKWKLQAENSTSHFTTTDELLDFVTSLLRTEVEYNVRQKEGYKHFWQDEHYTVDKKEEQVQAYIELLLTPKCQEKNISIHREVAAADGFIDMTFTYLDLHVCLEMKKAQHPDISRGTHKQLVAYMKAERTTAGIYLVLWYKSDGGTPQPKKYTTPDELEKFLATKSVPGYTIVPHVLDCTKPISPSKLR